MLLKIEAKYCANFDGKSIANPMFYTDIYVGDVVSYHGVTGRVTRIHYDCSYVKTYQIGNAEYMATQVNRCDGTNQCWDQRCKDFDNKGWMNEKHDCVVAPHGACGLFWTHMCGLQYTGYRKLTEAEKDLYRCDSISLEYDNIGQYTQSINSYKNMSCELSQDHYWVVGKNCQNQNCLPLHITNSGRNMTVCPKNRLQDGVPQMFTPLVHMDDSPMFAVMMKDECIYAVSRCEGMLDATTLEETYDTYRFETLSEPILGLKDKNSLVTNYKDAYGFICEKGSLICDINNSPQPVINRDISDPNKVMIPPSHIEIEGHIGETCRVKRLSNVTCLNETQTFHIEVMTVPCYFGPNAITCDSQEMNGYVPDKYMDEEGKDVWICEPETDPDYFEEKDIEFDIRHREQIIIPSPDSHQKEEKEQLEKMEKENRRHKVEKIFRIVVYVFIGIIIIIIFIVIIALIFGFIIGLIYVIMTCCKTAQIVSEVVNV